ncbi:class I SAM-dependent methyltransferase [Streptomyces sp. C10-9-1]|uniref:class I SAM-dependent methyltransferase n=1 Tax=Streptomyces sp. C10-9-1 TaxID=1859285 RepID=UPI003F49CBCB
MSAAHILAAWDAADPSALHPSRAQGEAAYAASGRAQAEAIAAVLPAGCRMVDFGCGDGRVALPLKDLGYDVTGADASQRMLDRLAIRADTEIPTVRTAGEDLLEQLGRKQDAAVCLSVLIHHDYATTARLVAHLRDAVKSGGILILDWPTSNTPEEAQDWLEVSTWPTDKQTALCTELGLKPMETDLPWQVFRAVKPA